MHSNIFSKSVSMAILFFTIVLLSGFEKNSYVDSKIYNVEEIIEGNIIKLSNSQEVRLIGVDTSEYHKINDQDFQNFGKRSYDFTRREIQIRQVRLEYDGPEKDQNGRILAYVFRVPDNFFLNKEIIKQGFGTVNAKMPFKYFDKFKEDEKKARKYKRGLWQ